MITQNPSKLEKLIEFAKKGGIGTCVANQDISARSEADLMFYTGEVITVLKHIKDDTYLGYCEGVIGTFKGKTVKFNGSLKSPKSMKSEKHAPPPSQSSPIDNNSPKQASFLHPSDSVKGLSQNDANSDTGNDEQSSPSSPIINIIPDTSDNVYNAPLFNQNNVRVIVPRTSSLSYEHSVPISPRKQSTMPQLSSSPEPEHITSQRRNNTVPIIATNKERSINSNNSNSKLNNINSSSSSLSSSSSSPSSSPSPSPSSSPSSSPQTSNDKNDKITDSQRIYQPSPIDGQNQVNQIITRKRQNSTPTVSNNIIQNIPVGRGRLRGTSFNDSQIPGVSNIPHVNTSKLSKNEHHRSVSSPNAKRFYDSPSSSPESPTYNKRHSQLSISSKSFQDKSHDQSFNKIAENYMVNGRSSPSSPISLPPRSPPLGHYSPSTTPLPSPKMPQIKVLQEENFVIDDHDSPSTTPLPSPRFVPRNVSNNLRGYEGRAPTNTPASTPIIITPKITLEDSDLDDSDDQEESLISYASTRNNSANSSSPPNPAEVSTLKVENTSYSSSEQFSANESEDISSEDEYESKVEVKNESESGETQSIKSSKKKKDQILAIDEYGFVYDVSEEDIPPGADRIQRIIQAPGAEEKTTRTIRLYREREAKWVALLGSMDPIVARDSRKIKKLVRSGIPESVRGKAWQFMACADKYRKPGVYDELRNRQKLPIYDVIEKDIRRCYPDHIQFREETGFGQDDLHDILKAYAHYNPGVGYCQGMGRLVGMMLMQMPAEDTFWLLVATIEEYMVGYFTPTLSQIQIDSIVFEQLLAEHDPRLAQHLANNGVVPLMYMTQWFMTIFTMALPWASVLRVWDIFYFEGVKLFFRIGLAIMDCTKEHILKNCPTNSEILGFLLHIPHELLTPDLLLEAAFKIRLKRSVIRRMTKRAIAMEKNNEGLDSASVVTAGISKETRRGLMKKSKSADKLRIDGIEFKLVGE